MMDSRKLPVLKNYEFINANGIPCNLGFGAYGSVQLGKCLLTGQTVAIKKIGRKIAKAEVDIHLKLNHPNIIRMLDHYFDEKHECTYIILEYAENGTLFDYIREHGLKDKRMIRGIFMSVCDAIDYMHSKNIMHRDIKPQNILLDRKNVVKVCDFGFAVNCQPRMTLCGTVQYMAPQMILRKPYSHKIDIWGLGILLFQMIEGRAPFEGHTQEQVLDRMKKPIYFSKNFTAEEIDLVHKILKVDPNERPEIKEIIKSPCLRNSIRSSSDQSSKRSTLEQEKPTVRNEEKRSTADEEKLQKKIKIIEVIDLQQDKPEKAEKLEKTEKKNNYNIEIINIRDLDSEQQTHLSQKILPSKSQKVEKPISTGNIGSGFMGKQKISLKKATTATATTNLSRKS